MGRRWRRRRRRIVRTVDDGLGIIIGLELRLDGDSIAIRRCWNDLMDATISWLASFDSSVGSHLIVVVTMLELTAYKEDHHPAKTAIWDDISNP